MPSRRINNFPESRRGLGHVTLTIFGSTVGYPSDSLASCSEFVRIENSAIRSVVLENTTLEQNTKWIGSPVAGIWPFAYVGGYGTPIFGLGEGRS